MSSIDYLADSPVKLRAVTGGDVLHGVHLAAGERAAGSDELSESGSDPAATQGPSYAGLASGFLPLDRAAFEKAVDQFLEQFESIAAELVDFEPSARIFATMSVVALSAFACVVVIQKRQRSLAAAGTAAGDEAGFSYLTGLPHSWSWSIAKS
jgi:hypothetical protein